MLRGLARTLENFVLDYCRAECESPTGKVSRWLAEDPPRSLQTAMGNKAASLHLHRVEAIDANVHRTEQSQEKAEANTLQQQENADGGKGDKLVFSIAV